MPGKQFFSDDEKELLTELVQKYKSSIENKKSDAVPLTRKTKAWESLASDFNSTENVRPRTVDQLRKLWDNLKQRWKKEKAKQIRDSMATGGGPPPAPMDEVLSQIEAAIPHLSERVNNPYDSDRPLPSSVDERVDEIVSRMTQSNAEDSDEAVWRRQASTVSPFPHSLHPRQNVGIRMARAALLVGSIAKDQRSFVFLAGANAVRRTGPWRSW
ncbi:hypothetical protein HPB50_013498 [Hyalomma asiaticum]|uniref:Uncharacterized protein n=1 Tax=Hyalomma asiaticum TaxID=266040 RepID=A0ACB7SLQ4_HYAAI|nr:hypothetical protein HPB50_013498 [Hyalomma asiaticum]